MKRTILNGLAFKVWSPSLFELDATNSDIACVAVAFGQDHRWWVNVLMTAGHSHRRGPFRSRDDAIALIAGRREATANWGA